MPMERSYGSKDGSIQLCIREDNMTTEQADRELQDAIAKCGEGRSAVKGALTYALDAIEAVDTKGFKHPDILSMMDLPQRRYDCHSCREGSNWHTRDEVILRANGDLLDALDLVSENGGDDEESPLLPIGGAILHALDELQLLGVEGFKHPDEPGVHAIEDPELHDRVQLAIQRDKDDEPVAEKVD